MTTSAIIEIENAALSVSDGSGTTDILRGISVKINTAESVGIVGPSGAGKSSLMMLAGGLLRPSSGKIVIAGTNLNDLDEDGLAAFRRRHIGIIFQDFHLIPSMTALENVAVPLELAGEKNALQIAADSLDRVGLSHRLNHFPAQLSGGEQQRVAAARAFAPKPEILLADEPTGNLDGPTGKIVTDLLFDMQKQNKTTMLLITHDLKIAGLCDRILKIRDGLIDKSDEA